MKWKICGKMYKCNKCAYDKHVDDHKVDPFKIKKYSDIGDQLREIENKNNLFIEHIKNKKKKNRLMKKKKIIKK